MIACIFVVARHYAPCATLLYSGLEAGQIYLVESTVIDEDVDSGAVDFLVIEGVVLDTGGHAIVLHSFDIRNYHTGGKIRILAHVFEVTAVQRRTIYVDAGAEQHVLVAVTGFLAYLLAVE